MNEAVPYDEFAPLAENAQELGLAVSAIPAVSRVDTSVAGDQVVSSLRWGANPRPDLVFLHGGGQNAHTWDSVVLALGRSALAVDLPGHGHSSWRSDGDYTPAANARAVAAALGERVGPPVVLVGMSLGGLTAISLAAQFPELLRAMVIIDVTPESPARAAKLTTQQRGTVALVSGPSAYESFEAMADAAVAASPRRSAQAVRRGVRHNSRRLPDGRWAWRYDQLGRKGLGSAETGWQELSESTVPTALVRGGESGFVSQDDVEEFRRRKPDAQLFVVAGAGHAVQSDQPLELVRILQQFIGSL